ncbi:zinc finger domain-containing protein [Nonomuraea typhae]|uniref:zinc finger domain-containing protein n=1 Tax=Nonomuraea typhae TaxID=2603600 RepID=UPI0012FCB6B8|nr:hypothetical protein [Nonomuraea typhae]
MATKRVLPQHKRFETADVTCPRLECMAVKGQPCMTKARHRGMVPQDKLHPERRQKQDELDQQRAEREQDES